MARFVELIDRTKFVEGAILIGAVWVANRISSVIGTAAALAIALVLLIPYYWWRLKDRVLLT